MVRLTLPEGAVAWFASDLHLGFAHSDAASRLVTALDELPDGSLVLLGGDVVELLDAPEGTDAGALLTAHPDLVAALRRAQDERGGDLVWLVGNHDVRLLWDSGAQAAVTQVLSGCRFALAADVEVVTNVGPRRVWFEHGNQTDPFNRFADPTNPHDTPVGHHVVREVLPTLRGLLGRWIDDAAALAVPSAFLAFVTSRMFYRLFLARWRLAVLGVVALFVMRFAAVAAAGSSSSVTTLAGRAVNLALLGAIDVVVAIAIVIVIVAAHRTVKRLAVVPALSGARSLNRQTGEELAARHPDHVGIVTGHTHTSELRDQGSGFYANPGCSCLAVRALPACGWLPAVFRRAADVGWVTVQSGEEGVRAELYRGTVPELEGMSAPERWLTHRHNSAVAPSLAAAWPEGPTTAPEPHLSNARSVRRAAAALVAVSAAVTILSAVSPPDPGRLAALRDVAPLAFPLAATGATVTIGLALAVLALGLMRGQRRAHRVTVMLLGAATLGHLAKGLDLEEAALTTFALVWLLAVGDRFTVPARTVGLARRLGVLALALGAAVTLGVTSLELSARRPLGRATALAFRELWGAAPAAAGGARFVAAGLLGAGIGSVVVAALLVLQRRPRLPLSPVDREVRQLVLARGTDSLAYFALRSDKSIFRYGSSVLAYGVFGRVALVSPDPIGPPQDLERVLTAFLAYATDEAWIVAVLAAAPGPTRRYEALGLHSLYLGDEAIARFDQLDLDLRGSQYKSLRGAVHRASRAGYHVELWDPARLSVAQRAALDPLMAAGRRGEAERGFSMTLGRLFDPTDDGLLLAVALDGDGRPGAFCQFVPSADAGGWSLDVMRRDPAGPNGLMDFLLVETMRQLRDQGCTGLGLNFATMRAVVDPEAQSQPAGVSTRVQRRVLHSLSELFQIESLWQFNAKYNPEWRSRYLVYESASHLPEIATAVARAESFWEIPVVGRLLRPPGTGPG